MAVPKKSLSKTRTRLRYTQWKKDVIPQALKALSLAKSSRTMRGNFRFPGGAKPDTEVKSETTENSSNE
jgi:ribosomal protein L32